MQKMEIENEKNNTQEQIPVPQTQQALTKLSASQLQYLSQILGIKINQDEISFFSSIEDLASFINTIKFPDKKKNETKDTLIEDLKSLKSEESLNKLKEEKNKKFSENVKSNGKTTLFHTAEKDELSPTMHAFYFCDKSKQILSDKDAAEFKNMNKCEVHVIDFVQSTIDQEDIYYANDDFTPSIKDILEFNKDRDNKHIFIILGASKVYDYVLDEGVELFNKILYSISKLENIGIILVDNYGM